MKSSEKILLFIADYRAKNFISPSVREIAEAVNLKSTSTVHGHLHRLKSSGYIAFSKDTARAIVITELGERYLENIRKRAKFTKESGASE